MGGSKLHACIFIWYFNDEQKGGGSFGLWGQRGARETQLSKETQMHVSMILETKALEAVNKSSDCIWQLFFYSA